MIEKDLLGKGERAAEAFAGRGESLWKCGVDGVDQFDWCGVRDGHEIPLFVRGGR
jgi:hypothetical protein